MFTRGSQMLIITQDGQHFSHVRKSACYSFILFYIILTYYFSINIHLEHIVIIEQIVKRNNPIQTKPYLQKLYKEDKTNPNMWSTLSSFI